MGVSDASLKIKMFHTQIHSVYIIGVRGYDGETSLKIKMFYTQIHSLYYRSQRVRWRD